MDNYDGQELTAISFDPVVPAPPERRSEQRRTALLRVGKLVVAGEERLCMIRNISSAGAMLKIYQPLTAGAALRVEITPDCPVDASVVWSQEGLAGVAFAAPIDVITALKGGRSDGPYRRIARTPRLRVSRPARMCTETLDCAVMLCDVSLYGAKFETEEPLATHSEVALFVDGLPPLSGRVRWCRDRRAGMAFAVPIPIDVLAGWIGPDGAELDLS